MQELRWQQKGNELRVEGPATGWRLPADHPWKDVAEWAERLVIGEGCTEVDAFAFENFPSLRSLHLPETLRFIGYRAFAGCTALRELRLPEALEELETESFGDCCGLQRVILGRARLEIGSEFDGCTALTEILADPENEKYRSVDGILYSRDGRKLWFYPCGRRGPFAPPEGVTALAPYAFFGSRGLTEIHLPDALREISWSAFCGCSSLRRVRLGAGVTEIGDYAFADCSALETLWLPEGLCSIGMNAFDGCRSLKDLLLPASVTDIGENAFRGVPGLSGAPRG